MGGVGKTKLALQYVYESRKIYDAILWVSAENSIKMSQSFLGIAQRLKLMPENHEAQDGVVAMSKVKGWLRQTRQLNFSELCFAIS